MKVVIDTEDQDREGFPVVLEVGYKIVEDSESGERNPLLWFETPTETVTVKLTPAKVRVMACALKLLADTLE